MADVIDIQKAIVAEMKLIDDPASLTGGKLKSGIDLDECGFTASDLPFMWVQRGALQGTPTDLGSGLVAAVRNYPLWLYVVETIGDSGSLDSAASYDTASNWLTPILTYWWDRQFLTTSDGTAFRVVGFADNGDVGMFGRDNSRRFAGVIFNLQIETIEQQRG